MSVFMEHDPIESKAEARLYAGVKKRGGSAIKIMKRPGYPDRIIVIPGSPARLVFVEVKRLTGRLAGHQVLAHEILRAMGCEVVTLYGYPDVDRFLKDAFGG
jgi:hypothetical protein